MPNSHEQFMRIALEEAQIAKEEGNEAVGSIIVCDGEVIARGRNLVPTTNDLTAHAETVALREAGKLTGRTDYRDCTLYTTFEPCPMCCGAIIIAGIRTLVMGGRPSQNARLGNYTVEKLIEMASKSNSIDVVNGILTEECQDIR